MFLKAPPEIEELYWIFSIGFFLYPEDKGTVLKKSTLGYENSLNMRKHFQKCIIT